MTLLQQKLDEVQWLNICVFMFFGLNIWLIGGQQHTSAHQRTNNRKPEQRHRYDINVLLNSETQLHLKQTKSSQWTIIENVQFTKACGKTIVSQSLWVLIILKLPVDISMNQTVFFWLHLFSDHIRPVLLSAESHTGLSSNYGVRQRHAKTQSAF